MASPASKYWEIIADNLSKVGWSWGSVATVDSNGESIRADAHRDDGKRFVVHAMKSSLRFWNWNQQFALLVSVISPFAVKRQYQNVLPIFLVYFVRKRDARATFSLRGRNVRIIGNPG